MSDSVIITKSYREDHWVVSAEILQDGSGILPRDVFIYENTGSNTLGAYQGVCGFDELQRLKIWAGETTPVFGNRFLRYHKAESHLSRGADPDRTVSIILASLDSLKKEILSNSESSHVYSV